MPGAPLSIFISYSRADSAFVDQLEVRLKVRGFDTWVDRHKLEGGDLWLKEIQKQIDRCSVCLVVISPEAVASEYVSMEYGRARRLKKRVIPVYLRSISDEEWPIDLEQLQRVDFLRSYDQGLADLLLALNRQEVVELSPPPRLLPDAEVPAPLPAASPASPRRRDYPRKVPIQQKSPILPPSHPLSASPIVAAPAPLIQSPTPDAASPRDTPNVFLHKPRKIPFGDAGR